MNITHLFRAFGAFLSALALTTLAGCDIDQTAEGELPDVDIEVSGGQMPEFDVETADVEVDKKKVTVDVPDVDVDVSMEEKSFNVPDVDIVMPDDNTEVEAEMDGADNDGADADERS